MWMNKNLRILSERLVRSKEKRSIYKNYPLGSNNLARKNVNANSMNFTHQRKYPLPFFLSIKSRRIELRTKNK